MTDIRLNGPPELVAAASNLERCGFVEGERVEYKPGNKSYKAVMWRPVE